MRIWFNHWFSTAYHLINLMKEREPERFVFIGSATNPNAIYKKACQEFYPERHDVSGEEYLEFCLRFCREHEVDVFVPRHDLVSIVRARKRFEDAGVRLFAEKNGETVSIMDDKLRTYELLGTILPERVPEFRMARSLQEFEEAVSELSGRFERVCYKLAIDEGAQSFRVIDDRVERPGSIFNTPGNKVTFSGAMKVMGGYDFRIPVLVMPFLEEVEISVDCLKTGTGNIVIPRFKSGSRYSEVVFDRQIMDECSMLMDRLDMHMPFNIQYKKSGGRAYILELNTRMSGGLQQSCLASGINIPMIALYGLLGEEIAWGYPPGLSSVRVANIETPVCL